MIQHQEFELKDGYRILIGRLFIIAFVLSLSILQSPAEVLNDKQSEAVYQIFVFYSLISLSYFLIIRIFPVQRTFIFFQLILDLLVVTLFSTITGLTDSIFTNLYFVIIITGSIFLSFTQGILIAVIGSFLISTVTYATHSNVINILPGQIESHISTLSWQLVTAKVLTLAFGMHIVAILSGYIANNYRNEGILISEILTNLSNGVLVFNRKNNITYINAETKNLFNLQNPLEYYLGNNIKDIAEEFNCELIQEFINSKDNNAQQISHKRNGSEIVIEIRSIPVFNNKKEIKAIIFIFSDRTLQKEIVELSKRAQRLSYVNDLAANIVHEIRNPIACISGAVEEVRHSSQLDESDQQLLKIVSRESDRLNDIMTSFLEYSKIKSNPIEKCHLNEIFNELLTLLRVRPNTDQIEFELFSSNEYFSKGDQNQLHQIFLNLSINSIEALNNQGKITFSINTPERENLNKVAKTYFNKTDNIIEVKIHDNGPGIKPEIIEKIFDPFYTTKAAGTGLGLSIVQKIVESQGGLIQVVSNQIDGTTFKIYLIAYPNE
ncbi:MAG: hypothetical protein COA79_03170 [Planctomycetota bacterium]|nr:MAG: hypothetical protein COA79_03170 [Planctomycetota bacterium]